MGLGAPHLGIGGFLILLILSFVFHKNLFTMFTGGSTADQPVASEPSTPDVDVHAWLSGRIANLESQREGVLKRVFRKLTGG